jgi:hypothetical protein
MDSQPAFQCCGVLPDPAGQHLIRPLNHGEIFDFIVIKVLEMWDQVADFFWESVGTDHEKY